MIAVQWDRSLSARRLRRGGRVVQTAAGQVEYASVGNGPAVLVLHGGVGGWDQGLALGVSLLVPADEEHEACVDYHRALTDGSELMRNRFTLIAPSRVGYLRTPLSTGRTPEEGADAMAALLDTLGIDNAVVIGVSGGGPTALQFAIRHASRTSSLVMVAAITKQHVQPSRTADCLLGKIVFARGFGWFVDLCFRGGIAFAALAPDSFTRLVLSATENFDGEGIEDRLATIRRDPRQYRWMRGLLYSCYPLSLRRTGLNNDLEQFSAIEDYPVEQIACPTLIVHGRHDGNVTFDHAEFVAQGVPGARMVVAESCGHLIWMSEEERKMRDAVIEFVEEHALR
jgi:pimeloyl-ACP methyl ester carboxylesterase